MPTLKNAQNELFTYKSLSHGQGLQCKNANNFDNGCPSLGFLG